MKINLLKIDAVDAERIAYAEGLTTYAELFGRIDELESRIIELESKLNNVLDDSLSEWERKNGLVYEYYQFFKKCFNLINPDGRLPSINSSDDRELVFKALRKNTS